MQKRQGGKTDTTITSRTSNSTLLPLTEADTTTNNNINQSSSAMSNKKHPKRGSGGVTLAPNKLMIIGIILLITFGSFTIFRPSKTTTIFSTETTSSNIIKEAAHLDEVQEEDQHEQDEMNQEQQQQRNLPLSHFPTLNKALEESELVGIYFAAQWCPMSTPVTHEIANTFTELDMKNKNSDKYELSIVYVSSDTDETSMLDYSNGKGWTLVPFENVMERSQMKQHFGVCALKEVNTLGVDIDRKYGIPTLIIVDGPTQGILTVNGADDLHTHKSSTLKHWQQLQQRVRR